jgi:hypothetical protein
VNVGRKIAASSEPRSFSVVTANGTNEQRIKKAKKTKIAHEKAKKYCDNGD